MRRASDIPLLLQPVIVLLPPLVTLLIAWIGLEVRHVGTPPVAAPVDPVLRSHRSHLPQIGGIARRRPEVSRGAELMRRHAGRGMIPRQAGLLLRRAIGRDDARLIVRM